METARQYSPVLDQLLPNAYVHNVDAAGRLLVGYDDSGSQLDEVGSDGRRCRLSDLTETALGRYLPGQRTVVEHEIAATSAQLSALSRAKPPGPSPTPTPPAPAVPASSSTALHHSPQPPASTYLETNTDDGDDPAHRYFCASRPTR